MGLAYIGPVAVAPHYDPSFDWSADPAPSGMRGVQIIGRIDWDDARALGELVANPARRQSFGGATGVLELVWADDALQREFNGWHLLQRFDINAGQRDSLHDIVPFALSSVLLSKAHIVAVTRSARAKDNAYSLTARATVVQPLWGEDPDGEPFMTAPGGTAFSRDYDPRTGLDVREPTTANRRLRIHAGTVT